MRTIALSLVVASLAVAASARPARRAFVAVNGRAVSGPSGGSAGADAAPAPQARRAGALPRASSGGGRGGLKGFSRRIALRRDDSADAPPPYYYTPGALIRTEGAGFAFTPPALGARTNSVEAGIIELDPLRAVNLSSQANTLKVGPRDTPPPCTAGIGGCTGSAGRNDVTDNYKTPQF